MSSLQQDVEKRATYFNTDIIVENTGSIHIDNVVIHKPDKVEDADMALEALTKLQCTREAVFAVNHINLVRKIDVRLLPIVSPEALYNWKIDAHSISDVRSNVALQCG